MAILKVKKKRESIYAKDAPYKPPDPILSINLNELEEQWAEQPDKFRAASDELGWARSRNEEHKAELKLVEAELRLAMLRNPEKYELPKTTADALDASIQTHRKYQKAKLASLAAQELVEHLAALVFALAQRKDALENEVRLHGQNYFSTPRDNGGEMNETKKRMARSKHRRD